METKISLQQLGEDVIKKIEEDKGSSGDENVIESISVNGSVIEPDVSKNVDIEIPPIPTELPASDVYEWAKQPEKPKYTASEVDADIKGSADNVKKYTDQRFEELIGTSPENLDTIYELAKAVLDNEEVVESINEAITKKVDKVDGKGLSTNDVTDQMVQTWNGKSDFSGNYNDLTNKPEIPTVPDLASVATSGLYSDLIGTPNFANVATSGNYNDLSGTPEPITVDSAMSETSTNPVQNKVIFGEVDNIKSNFNKLKPNIEGDIIWQNSNPTDMFESQNISIDTSKYNRYKIYYRSYYNSSALMSEELRFSNSAELIAVMLQKSSESLAVMRRFVSRLDNAINFGVGTVHFNGGNVANDNNYCCIPQIIVGYKSFEEFTDSDNTGGSGGNDGDNVSDKVVEFLQSETRENIQSGSTLANLFAKIKKWFADLKAAAFCDVVNDTKTTEAGKVLDARVGKTLKDDIGDLSSLPTEDKTSLVDAVTELNGKICVDGQLYVELGRLPNSTSKSVSFTLPNGVKNFWISSAVAISGNTRLVLPYLSYSNLDSHVDIRIIGNEVNIRTTLDWSGYFGYAIIDYIL